MDKPSAPNRAFPTLNHLAIIAVSGEDSSKFLQGQLTCDVYGLSALRASVAAFCNPKGRVISTLLVVKTGDGFLLILPASLRDKVLNKLKMYVLRSAVRLLDQSQNLRLFGFHALPSAVTALSLPVENFAVGSNGLITVKLPSAAPRYLCITDQPQIPASLAQQDGVQLSDAEHWRYTDISSGFPWFEAEQSELYIPQMLNIDGLGGISFNKGCYTGQEIVARTHYLGKAKRHLFLAECGHAPNAGTTVLDSETKQNIGSVLSAQMLSQTARLLAVLQLEDAESKHLALDDAEQTAIKILPIQ